MRIGAGGLWGGFGWLWTSRKGMVEFYVSRTDGFVLITRPNHLDILITPSTPEAFLEKAGNAQRVLKQSSEKDR